MSVSKFSISNFLGFANISFIDSRLVHPLYVRFGVGSHVRENKIASVDSSDGACEEVFVTAKRVARGERVASIRGDRADNNMSMKLLW